jgi:hypothetical protein
MASLMTTVETPKARNIPVWLAILLILLCAGGGGFLAYHFLLGGSDEKIILLERAPSETIREFRPNQWIMRTTNAGGPDGQVVFDLTNAQKPKLNFQIYRHDLSHEQNVLLWLGARRNISEELKLTEDEHIKLNGLANAAHVEPPQATLDAMNALFQQWNKAPEGKDKEAMEDKLFTMLQDAVKSIDAQSKSAAIDKADKVRTILTPEQLKLIPGIRLPWGG